MRHTFTTLVVLGILVSTSPSQTLANQPTHNVTWDWTSPVYTECEGVGVHGTSRYFADVEYKTEPSAPKASYITHISLYGESAAFSSDDTALLATMDATVKGTNQWVNARTLSRPTVKSIEPEPGAYETRRIYWTDQPGQHFPLANTGDFIVRLRVQAVKDNCSVNSSSYEHLWTY